MAAIETSPIYTKTGDDGTTGLLFGGRVSKADPLVDVYGTLDEAITALGLARAASSEPELNDLILAIQRGLFVASADLAASPSSRHRLVPAVSLVGAEMIADLERSIDRLVGERPLRPVFVVPGESLDEAALDLGRAIVRRAERRLVAAGEASSRFSPNVLVFLNRASDLLYVLARRAAGSDEPISHE